MKYRVIDIYTGEVIIPKKKSDDEDRLTEEEFIERLTQGDISPLVERERCEVRT